MTTMRGLGLMESCILTRDIGYQTNRERDLPRFGVLDEEKLLLHACLILIYRVKYATMGQPIDYYGELAERQGIQGFLLDCVAFVCCCSTGPLLAFI
jgi:hypothetical protein